MALQIKGVTAGVKAFESLKKNVLFARVRRELKVKAMLHHADCLKAKAVKAFDVALTLRLVADRVHQSYLLRVTKATFNAWEDQLQLKLCRKDAFTVCRMVLMRRALKHWKQKGEESH
jgi:hypothetical protein